MPTKKEIADLAERLTKQYADEGRMVEAGWVALRALHLGPTASEEQVQDMRFAYMAGAQHLFTSIMGIMDAGEEPTEHDYKMLDLIHKELEAYRKELELRFGKPEGQA
jgi:hypothetical protein